MARPVSESLSAQDLGVVHLERSNAPSLLTLDEPLPPDADLFLSAALDRIRQEGGAPRLLFVATEDEPRDAGLVALGLARVAAGRGVRVLLVDLGLDSPVLAKPFPYQPEEGFVDMVLWGSSFPAVLRKTRDERIGIVCVGSPPPDPDPILEDPACDAVLGTLRGEAELVIAVGRLRSGAGAPSPMLRKADRTLVVRIAGGEVPSFEGMVPPDRLSVVTLGEELPGVRTRPEGPRTPDTKEKEAPPSGEKRRLPLVRIGLFVALLSIAAGVVLSGVYLRHREETARGRVELARRDAGPSRAVPAGTPGETSPAAGAASPAGAATEAPPRTESAAPGGVPPQGGVTFSEEGPPAPETGSAARAPVGEEAIVPYAVSAPLASGSEEPGAPGQTAATASPSAQGAASPTTPGAAPGAESPRPEQRPAFSTVPPREGTKQPAPPPTGTLYGVHVESFPSRAEAERGAVRFRESGEKVTIVEKEIPEKGTWYRIILGQFATQREAGAHAEEIKETFGLSYALVVRLSP